MSASVTGRRYARRASVLKICLAQGRSCWRGGRLADEQLPPARRIVRRLAVVGPDNLKVVYSSVDREQLIGEGGRRWRSGTAISRQRLIQFTDKRNRDEPRPRLGDDRDFHERLPTAS